jgi:hypothetical protein
MTTPTPPTPDPAKTLASDLIAMAMNMRHSDDTDIADMLYREGNPSMTRSYKLGFRDARHAIAAALASDARVAAVDKLAEVARMAMQPERDAYDQYHDWHDRLKQAASDALAPFGGTR